MPFLRNATAGRGIPDERLTTVAEHYYSFGGKSPINDQNRALLTALREELDRREIPTPLLWGNRNFHPFVTDALREAHEAGIRRVVTIVTSAYSCYSSCRQYREDLAAAVQTLADEGRVIEVDKVRPYFNHPGFSRVNTRHMTEAVRALGPRADNDLRLVFVTHSIPGGMDDTSGPGDGDEVRFDLDTEAAETAAGLGLEMVRVPTVGADPEFVSGLVDLVSERAAQARGQAPVDVPSWPGSDAFPPVCRPGCCPNLRAAKPALCGSD